jgi:hypothetical protein
LRKSTDENDHSQTRQGEEIGTPPAQCTSPKRGRQEEFTEMNPSNTGHGRQTHSVNSKKKPDSEEEDKEEVKEEEEEEDEEEEEEEIATALDSKEVSHVHVDLDACDHSKQGLESEIAQETQNDPESEVTDGCDPSKKHWKKLKFPTRYLILMQMINPNKDQNQRWVQKINKDQNQKLQRVVTLPQINQVTILDLKLFLQERVVLMTIVMDLQYYNLTLHSGGSTNVSKILEIETK